MILSCTEVKPLTLKLRTDTINPHDPHWNPFGQEKPKQGYSNGCGSGDRAGRPLTGGSAVRLPLELSSLSAVCEWKFGGGQTDCWCRLAAMFPSAWPSNAPGVRKSPLNIVNIWRKNQILFSWENSYLVWMRFYTLTSFSSLELHGAFVFFLPDISFELTYYTAQQQVSNTAVSQTFPILTPQFVFSGVFRTLLINQPNKWWTEQIYLK